MKVLKDILFGVSITEVAGSTNIAVQKISFDSRNTGPFGLFIAVKGTQTDGHQYIEKAIASGTTAIICESLPAELKPTVTYIKVKNAAETTGIIASNFYDNPSESLQLIGITGTNGKTTCATLLFHLFRNLGESCGLLSTIQNRINENIIPSTHTTPDAIRLNELLKQMVDAGCKYCFMEVSSHAVVQHRIEGLKFTGGVFTNITHDHLDYHGTFENYLQAKRGFFRKLTSEAFAIYNRDDYHAEEMRQGVTAKIKTYGLRSAGDYYTRILENQFGGLLLQINGKDVWTQLIGRFNAYNLSAIYATAELLGKDPLEILTAMSKLQPAEGRFQYFISEAGITAIVDYAHTPDALKNVLNTISDIRTGNEQVITVVGCGGDRDREKRPVMAQIAADNSNRVVLTSDNPRSEEPADILKEMEAGMDPVQKRKTLTIENRREAIRTACSMAQKGDIVLIAGKGHEKYQEIKGVKYDFDDMQVLRETLILTEK
jgi:UDP-N-acetylmuramoyl-L-alanyl-D-glutamate--2,6-diaminopimelate ligase